MPPADDGVFGNLFSVSDIRPGGYPIGSGDALVIGGVPSTMKLSRGRGSSGCDRRETRRTAARHLEPLIGGEAFAAWIASLASDASE